MTARIAALLLLLLLTSLAGCGLDRFTDETLLSDRDLVGYPVEDEGGERVGEVAALIVELNDGEIEYIVVELPSHPRAAAAHTLVALPWRELTLDRDGHRLVMAVASEVLRAAPHFEALPNTREPGWDEALRDYWDEQ